MVDSVDYVRVWCEQRVCFDFLKGLGDRFLAEGTTDLLECVERGVRGVLDEVDVGETTLYRERTVSALGNV